MKATQITSALISPTSFSVDQLKRISNNNEEFIIKMLNLFVFQASQCSDMMQQAILTNDWAKLKAVSHKNISSYSIMNLHELVELLKFIESNAEKKREHWRVKEFVDSVCEKNADVIKIIGDYIYFIRKG